MVCKVQFISAAIIVMIISVFVIIFTIILIILNIIFIFISNHSGNIAITAVVNSRINDIGTEIRKELLVGFRCCGVAKACRTEYLKLESHAHG